MIKIYIQTVKLVAFGFFQSDGKFIAYKFGARRRKSSIEQT